MTGSTWALGGIAVEGRAVLAPLSGVTDVVFRRIASRFGAALVVSEMVAADDLVLGSEEARLRAEGSGIWPHVVQLAGCNPDWMSEAVKVAENSGATIIDINMGCPAKRVTGGYSGSALMRDLDLATAIIAATVKASTVPVTVKMRLGWDDKSRNAAELARRAEALGAAAVTVHGRTRQQFYKGKADWRAIADVSQQVTIPLIANGDITCLEDARQCLQVSHADAVMIGRSAMGQPWIVGRVAAGLSGQITDLPSATERSMALLEHYEGLLSLYGIHMGIRHARKHLAAYVEVARLQGFKISDADRLELVTSETPDRVRSLLANVYSEPERKAA